MIMTYEIHIAALASFRHETDSSPLETRTNQVFYQARILHGIASKDAESLMECGLSFDETHFEVSFVLETSMTKSCHRTNLSRWLGFWGS